MEPPARTTCSRSELIIRAEQQRLLSVMSAGAALGPGDYMAMFQCGLLCVLLVCWREVVNCVLHNVMGVHGLLQTA